MKYSLAIFDMDGTILYTLGDLRSSLNYALTTCGYPARTLEEVRCFVGNGIHRLVELGVPKGTSNTDIDNVFCKFNEHYAIHCFDTTRPYDGINDTIKILRHSGIKTAVVSNKADYAVQSLCIRYFPGLFDFAVGAKDGVRKKPFPDSVNTVLLELGADRSQSVYIGDSEVDIQTANNAGISCVSVDWGFRSQTELISAGAENIISNPSALTEYLLH